MKVFGVKVSSGEYEDYSSHVIGTLYRSRENAEKVANEIDEQHLIGEKYKDISIFFNEVSVEYSDEHYDELLALEEKIGKIEEKYLEDECTKEKGLFYNEKFLAEVKPLWDIQEEFEHEKLYEAMEKKYPKYTKEEYKNYSECQYDDYYPCEIVEFEIED